MVQRKLMQFLNLSLDGGEWSDTNNPEDRDLKLQRHENLKSRYVPKLNSSNNF